MTRTKLLSILQEETDGFKEQSRLRDDVLDAMEQAYIKGKNEQLTIPGTKGDEERKHKCYYCKECGFKFILADNASENDLKTFKSFEIFHTNPILSTPCRNELTEISQDEFLKLP